MCSPVVIGINVFMSAKVVGNNLFFFVQQIIVTYLKKREREKKKNKGSISNQFEIGSHLMENKLFICMFDMKKKGTGGGWWCGRE